MTPTLNPTTVPPPGFDQGIALLRQGRALDALPHLETALRLAPTHLATIHACASSLEQLGRVDDMAEVYTRALQELPNEASVLAGLARSWLLRGDRVQARAWLERAHHLAPSRPAVAGLLGLLLREDGEPDAACSALQAAVLAHPEHPELLWEYAQSLFAADRLGEAAEHFQRFRARRPGQAVTEVALGRIAAAQGAIESACESFRSALTLDPAHAPAWWELSHVKGASLDAQERGAIDAAMKVPMADFHLALFEDVLTRAADRSGDHPAAAMHAERANGLHALHRARNGNAYRPDEHTAEVDRLIAGYRVETIQAQAGAGDSSRRPVFVFGLPRSGTTLLERMLAAHPQVAGIGEQLLAQRALERALRQSAQADGSLRPDAVRAASQWHLQAIEQRRQQLAPQRAATRVVDKLPDNYLLAGWLAIAFPHATLIHCLRDPRDVALSCWMAQFAQIGWSFDLEHIAHRIEQHRRVMQHWRALLGDRLTEVRYESVVEDPQVQVQRLLNVMQLPWNDDVLAFDRHAGVVRSASQMQVREPINRRGVGRWRRYAEVLAPILPRLDAIAVADADLLV